MLIQYGVVAVVATLAWLADAEIGGSAKGAGGWLARLVAYHKQAFLNDFEKYDSHLVDIKASVEPAYEGYEDSPAWDHSSVMRLLTLVSHSRDPSVKPVRRALRRALRPTRRYAPYIPKGMDSHDLFPSLSHRVPNFIYNDYSDETTSEELNSDEQRMREWEEWNKRTTTKVWNASEHDHLAILVVRNPVEARLPSARISVNLLRKIMEERALAARGVTISTRRTRTWLPRYNATTAVTKKANVTTHAPTPANGTDAKEGAGDAATTGAPAADGAATGTTADGGATTADAGAATTTEDPGNR